MALALPPRTSSAKALLFVLSFMSRPTRTEKLECFPSVGYLVAVTGQNRKTIIANLDKLERWGLLSDTGRRMGVTRQVIVYRLHMRAKISTRIPQGYEAAKKRRPKTTAKAPEKCSKAFRKRDTESSTNIYKKSCRAPAGALAPVRSAAGDSAPDGAGTGRKDAVAQMDALILAHVPRARAESARSGGRDGKDPRNGGAA
jgi:hypothetical protein